MDFQFDDNGKTYTNIIQKDPVSATIQTIHHSIRGTIYVRRGERVKDELDDCAKFLPVTDASIYDPGGSLLYRSSFMVLNLAHVVWLILDSEILEGMA